MPALGGPPSPSIYLRGLAGARGGTCSLEVEGLRLELRVCWAPELVLFGFWNPGEPEELSPRMPLVWRWHLR